MINKHKTHDQQTIEFTKVRFHKSQPKNNPYFNIPKNLDYANW